MESLDQYIAFDLEFNTGIDLQRDFFANNI